MKIILRAILITVVQAIVLIVPHDFFVSWYAKHYSMRHDIAWGISLQLYIWLFLAIAFITNILCLKYGRKKWLFLLIAFTLFFALLIPTLHYAPYRVGLFLACAALGLLTAPVVFYLARRTLFPLSSA